MKIATAIDLMQELRDAGWTVVLKCSPRAWIIEGSRSEFDAPCEDHKIGKGKWCCEAQWIGDGPYRHSGFALHGDPTEAVRKVVQEIKNRPEPLNHL